MSDINNLASRLDAEFSLEGTSMIPIVRTVGCSIILLVLLGVGRVHGQIAAGARYNPYTGGGGRAAVGYNPYTGTRAASRSYYNPYTGASGRATAAYNPYTGRTGYRYSYRR